MWTGPSEPLEAIYAINVRHYVRSLPFKRRILAKLFEKHRVTKEEYDKWFYSGMGELK